MKQERRTGGYPVIGIRPVIDGRRGVLKVRESLEDQTMGMAKAAEKLFRENLFYSNGEPAASERRRLAPKSSKNAAWTSR